MNHTIYKNLKTKCNGLAPLTFSYLHADIGLLILVHSQG